MTFAEALEVCEQDEWKRFVLMNPDILGLDTFLTKSYYRKPSNGPVSGAVDRSKGWYLRMTIYKGGNDFEDVEVPYKIVDPLSEGWEAEIFHGDISIDEFEVAGVTLSMDNDGQIDITGKAKLKKLLEKAAKEEFRIDKLKVDIEDVASYFE
jgi:hypothetical protein